MSNTKKVFLEKSRFFLLILYLKTSHNYLKHCKNTFIYFLHAHINVVDLKT